LAAKTKSKSALVLRVALAMAVGTFGGLIFSYLGTPMPWMLGSLFACLVGSLLNLPMTPPMALRSPMIAIVGIMMGAGYSPELIGQISAWWATILGLVLFMSTVGLACVAYFRFVVGYDLPTAYFSGMPGGLVEMLTLSDGTGADPKRVALIHSARIVLTVFSVPFIVQWIEGASITRVAGRGVSFADMDAQSYIWLAVCFFCGLLLARLVKLPARYLMGPLIVSVGVHVTGLSNFKPPSELVLIAQLVLGTVIGCRFAGSRAFELMKIFGIAVGSTILMIGISSLFALGLSQLTNYSFSELLLAYSPGGLAEMGLLALALHLDVALVSTHHIFRILIVVAGASFAMPLFGIRSTSRSAR
jgi:membrane AbrB-like protein